jgi:predicted RNA-binding protein Jag
MHENWLRAPRYLNMDYWREHKKERLRTIAQAASAERARRGRG